MGFLIHFSIPNLYLYNYSVYIATSYAQYLLIQRFILDPTVVLATNSTPSESITD